MLEARQRDVASVFYAYNLQGFGAQSRNAVLRRFNALKKVLEARQRDVASMFYAYNLLTGVWGTKQKRRIA